MQHTDRGLDVRGIDRRLSEARFILFSAKKR